jgi:hypothetical protein
MNRLKIAYKNMPDHLRKEYPYEEILKYTFTGFPELTKIQDWYDNQEEKLTIEGAACLTVLASRKIAFENGATNEQELQAAYDNIIDRVFKMVKEMSERGMLMQLGETAMEKEN